MTISYPTTVSDAVVKRLDDLDMWWWLHAV